MKFALQFLRWYYGLLLQLYPRNYREEYREELQAVFDLSLDEAVAKGGFEMEKLILRELISLPRAILLEYLHERRKRNMIRNFASVFDFAPGSHSEILAALTPFLFFGALPTLLGYFHVSDLMPLWLDIGLGIVYWLFGLILILIGSVKRFPRWFMPYIGVPMPIISILLFNSLMEKLQGVWWYRLPWFVGDFLQQGLLWMWLFILVVLLLVSSRLIPKSRRFYQRLRKDWTLLSFILYGTMPLVLVIVLNEYKNVEPYMFLAFLILAAGGWLYLRSDDPWYRFALLQAGMSLSMFVAAVAKALLAESSFPFARDNEWQIEFTSTIISWLWLTMLMMIPLLFQLLPRSKEHLQTT